MPTQNKWQLPQTVNDSLEQAVLTDIPNALLNIRSCHGGTLDPAIAANNIGSAKHMFWADEATSLLKFRNLGDSTWYPVGPLEDNFGLLPKAGGVMSGDLDFDGAGNIVIDADGDSALVFDTDDELSIELGGAEEYLFRADYVDFKGNNLRNMAMSANTATPSGATVQAIEHKDSSGTSVWVPGYAAQWS